MQVPHQIIDIVKFPGKPYKFKLVDDLDSRSDYCGTPLNILPVKILSKDIEMIRGDIEDSGFVCLKIKDDSENTTVWVIWDPTLFDPQSAFKKHRRSQSDQKVSKKRSKNKKTKRSGKKHSTRKTSKRKPRKV